MVLYIYLYINIWGILMVNVTIYSTHGSYGLGDRDYVIMTRVELSTVSG